MKRTIELKHVAPKEHVRHLLEELLDRLEEKLSHFPSDAVSIHAVFEENGSHTLYRTSLTCHVPGHMIAAHDEHRDAGATIREAFAELERQLEKRKAFLRHEHLRRHQRTPLAILAALGISVGMNAQAQEQQPTPPSPKAVEALQLLESEDAYRRQLGFLRLEALREPGTAQAIRVYMTHRDPELRAYSLRALAAIEGVQAVPLLLEKLQRDRQPRVRLAALLGLEPLEQSSPEILPAFLKALRDRSTEVRMAAVDVVSRVDAPQAREAILMRYKRERRRDVRRVLKLAMNRLGFS